MLGYTFYEVDSRVQQYSRALVARGDEVEFVGLRKPGQPAEGTLEGVRIFGIQDREYDEKRKVTYLFKLLQFLTRASLLLSRRHLRQRYDIIHVHNVPDFLVFAAWFPKLAGAKIILDIHDVTPEFYVTKFNVPPGCATFQALLFLEKICTAFSDHVIIANDIWREKLISRCLAASKCTTLLNYPMYFVPDRPTRQKIDSRFTILYPGSLNHHQGVDIAVRALASMKDSIPDCEFHIFGEGGYSKNIAGLIEQFGLEKNVILHPPVSHEEIVQIMQSFDLGVDPKRADGFANEALGGKIFEFMACGLPAIVSDTQANKRYFSEHVVRFCRSDDPEDFAKSILAFYHDRESMNQLARNASKFVHSYQWDVQKSVYLALVDSLVRSPKKVSAATTSTKGVWRAKVR
jgi:glycosyltransferase involved in cell wall biosynthesis